MIIQGAWINEQGTQDVMHLLSTAGHQALFVGGCVRNAIIRAPVSDIDIATSATPQTVMDLCEAAGVKAIPTGFDHGTVTVVAGGIAHEVTTFRKDVSTDGRRAVVAFTDDVAQDARRRDFTMNALYADAAGALVDPLGGIDDLMRRAVRFIENPADRIREDYLRILRFFRFSAWYGDPDGGFDPDALAAIAELSDGIDALSRERVGSELIKLLSAPDPAPAVAAMRTCGALMHVLNGANDRWLAPLIHIEQALGLPPDPLRRLAVLGGTTMPDDLRLSRDQAKTLATLRDEIGGAGAAELGYRHGHDTALSIIALRAAIFEQMPLQSDLEAAKLGSNTHFPIRALDLSPDLQGAQIGQVLKSLEQKWIASGFTLTKEQLLLGQ